MEQQYEAISAAQSFGDITAQEMNDLYVSTERRGNRVPTAYAVSGDLTATHHSRLTL